ncbi:trehalose-phosphate phosphatase A [Raphidocelis subcapitata]|uniref:Trehalose 6-phosphate phosphatase n=1 Tax=Raphidocelis subcapitata TaxID=307507 RepID=A0A2V0NNH5_9CHLO|nr:trehalose-phosphate phosphatase A [Raphidocelis subcapitata]|eukprot:GBF88769.1 trehalose-phosphate phosphatase A [Raphidocelis subcapitata]
MRGACHSEPVLANAASGPSDDGLPTPGLCLDRARSLSGGLDEQDDPQLAIADYEGWKARHPCLLTCFDEFQRQLQGRRLAVFLDYDGTLTPIVRNPDEAVMSEQMRDAVRGVAGMFPTAIISGRGREKVESFVQLPELYYAGSHGMDIVGPRGAAVDGERPGGGGGGGGGGGAAAGAAAGGGGGEPFRFQAAAEYQPLIDRVYSMLRESLASIPGASVEHNKFCVSAHFRNCHPDSWQRVVAAVDAAVGACGGGRLHVTRGRKVLEVRPTVDWDKGSALLHLLEVLGLAGQPDVTAIYLGDDKTDEDAFAALAGSGSGAGVLVSTVAKPTAAAFTLRDPGEVLQVLLRLVAYGAGGGNGWRTYGGRVNGWAPTPAAAAAAAGAGAGGGGEGAPAAANGDGGAAARGGDRSSGGGGGGARALLDRQRQELPAPQEPERQQLGLPPAPAGAEGHTDADAGAGGRRQGRDARQHQPEPSPQPRPPQQQAPEAGPEPRLRLEQRQREEERQLAQEPQRAQKQLLCERETEHDRRRQPAVVDVP